MLVTELWGIGDLALAIPFLRAASRTSQVTLVAKPHAAPLLARFAPRVDLVPFFAPWTAFRGKYKLLSWPWGELGDLVRKLRARRFNSAASARPDPRDHVLLALAGASLTFGFPRAGSRFLLNNPLPRPPGAHRSEHWAAIASGLGVKIESPAAIRKNGKRVVIHAGAGHPSRLWPRERYEKLAESLAGSGWQTKILDDSLVGIDRLIEELESADRFIGNDSGPGHLAALLGIPTFTIFGPQLPELFAPRQTGAGWIEGAPCPFKPCSDYCRFSEPRCLTGLEVDAVRERVLPWLSS